MSSISFLTFPPSVALVGTDWLELSASQPVEGEWLSEWKSDKRIFQQGRFSTAPFWALPKNTKVKHFSRSFMQSFIKARYRAASAAKNTHFFIKHVNIELSFLFVNLYFFSKYIAKETPTSSSSCFRKRLFETNNSCHRDIQYIASGNDYLKQTILVIRISYII